MHHFYLADAYHNNIQDKQALENIEQGLTLAPNNIALLMMKASIYELQNTISDSSDIIEQILKIEPSNINALILKSRLFIRQDKLQEAKTLLTKLRVVDGLDVSQKQAIYSELVMANRANLDYKETWRNAELMNKVSAQRHKDSVTIEQIDQYFTQLDQCPLLQKSTSKISENQLKHNWLFIVGFPRVGSTLLEKCLFNTFDCGSASESKAIVEMEKQVFAMTNKSWWTLDLKDWQTIDTNTIIETAKNTYFTQGVNPEHALVDKNLLNLSRLLFIGHLLPSSPVVRIVRHPLDIVVSCFLNNFASHEAWHSNLKLTAEYLLRVEQYWFNIESKLVNPVYVLKYEELVAHETLPTALRDFLEQYWKASPTPVSNQVFTTRTASYAQVNQQINKSGLKTYLNYMDMLPAEIVNMLRPIAKRWGYHI